jgi:type I restriction enzyme, S subunit
MSNWDGASWPETTLGDVAEFFDHRRIPLSSSERSQRSGPYPYYGASGIIDRVDDFLFEGRFLLISEDGANLVTRSTPIAFFAEGRFWVNNHAHVVRGREGIANDYFLLSFIEHADISGYITGTAQPKLSQANLKAIKLRLPPLPVQERIADILSAYDALIDNNTRRIAILEEMAQAIYREWFVNFRFPGHEQVDMSVSELGPVPQGWEIRNLFDLADVTYGFPFKSKRFSDQREGLPVIRIRDILEGVSRTYTSEEVDPKYKVLNGDLLIGMDGDFHRGKWVGGAAYLNQRVARVRATGPLSPYHLFLALEAPIRFFNETITGTTVAHLGDKHLKQVNMVVPEPRVLQVATEILRAMFDLELNLRIMNQKLRSTRDLLLPKLVSGEVEVSALPEPEAAVA